MSCSLSLSGVLRTSLGADRLVHALRQAECSYIGVTMPMACGTLCDRNFDFDNIDQGDIDPHLLETIQSLGLCFAWESSHGDGFAGRCLGGDSHGNTYTFLVSDRNTLLLDLDNPEQRANITALQALREHVHRTPLIYAASAHASLQATTVAPTFP